MPEQMSLEQKTLEQMCQNPKKNPPNNFHLLQAEQNTESKILRRLSGAMTFNRMTLCRMTFNNDIQQAFKMMTLCRITFNRMTLYKMKSNRHSKE